jgi:hypothetical protein
MEESQIYDAEYIKIKHQVIKEFGYDLSSNLHDTVLDSILQIVNERFEVMFGFEYNELYD